jgi:hypothetical protein
MGVMESVKAVMWAVAVMNVSGAEPLRTVRLYGDHVRPGLRG